jgi:hypothetical protein
MEMKFGTFSVRNLYMPESLETVPRELAKNKSDLVGARELRLDNHSIEHEHSSMEMGMLNMT